MDPEKPKKRLDCVGRGQCGNESTDPHTCPYAEEINEDFESLCTCCDDCRRECLLDI